MELEVWSLVMRTPAPEEPKELHYVIFQILIPIKFLLLGVDERDVSETYLSLWKNL